MKIETKYNLGDHVIAVYENNKEVCLYDDFISWISIEDRGICYGLAESCTDYSSEEIFYYHDNEGIIKRIKEILENIRVQQDEEDKYEKSK